ncbi:hypothetical protein EV215_1640 [Hypnocyclicus thermotrophus]|uniref:Uncharacterized protein n=1 Tax=Hypnocyclicus thermotrophus TaxID=1627895 RepID=A0AA46I547_9FUSO|nr:hypothetical protein [Hypnocyclicus thermotrophus]TDT68573.1 hypothetical protein EV215_1640 [Hypnocyclicus thermotrophus]
MNIGYFKFINNRDSYISGLLIVDNRGIPIEFKYTNEIIPSKKQKLLYGTTLKSYLKEELMFKNLVTSLENIVDIVIVDSIEDISLNKYIDNKVVVIRKTQERQLKDLKEFQFVAKDELLYQYEEKENPIRVIFKEEFSEEIIDILNEIKIEDILEPINRIEEVLNEICNGN